MPYECCTIRMHWRETLGNDAAVKSKYIQDIRNEYETPSGRLVLCIYLGDLGYILDIFGHLLSICWGIFLKYSSETRGTIKRTRCSS